MNHDEGSTCHAISFPPASAQQIARLCAHTGQSPSECIRTLALMGLHMWAQVNHRSAVAAECNRELRQVAEAIDAETMEIDLLNLGALRT